MKKVSGIELLQMIENKEIKPYTKVFLLYKGRTFEYIKEMRKQGYFFYDFYTIVGNYVQLHLYRVEKGKRDVDVRTIDTQDLLVNDFYIEEKKENKLDKIKKKLQELIKDIKELEE